MIYVVIPWRYTSGRNLDARDVVRRHYEHAFPDAVVALADDPEPGPFNRGRAVNFGVEESHTRPDDVLVFADADLIVPVTQLLAAVDAVRDHAPSYVVPFDQVLFTDEATSARLCDTTKLTGPTVDLAQPLMGEVFDRLSTGGCNVLLRSSFDRVGGFDPRFRGWGFEDAAFDPAMRTLVGPPVWVTGRAIHLWHPTARNVDDPHHEASLALCRRYEAADGNRVEMSKLIAEHLPMSLSERQRRYRRETG